MTDDGAPGREWWRTYVPDAVVAAFDACATTGVGPTRAMAHEAFGTLASRLGELERLERPGEGATTTAEMVGEPALGLALFVRERYGWAVPDGSALDALARAHAGGRVVELGCGSGYVAACLRARGLEVEAVSAPEGACPWGRWWSRRFVDDVRRVRASEVAYDANAYLMLMPDRVGAGEDMMVEALTRMPVGATLHLYAPRGSAGSEAGFAILDAAFEHVGDRPMLDLCPWDSDEDRAADALRTHRKVSDARGGAVRDARGGRRWPPTSSR